MTKTASSFWTIPTKIENHTSADISHHNFWLENFELPASFWRSTRQKQVLKLKFVQAIKFWCGPVSTLAQNLL